MPLVAKVEAGSNGRRRTASLVAQDAVGRFTIASFMDERGAVRVDEVADAFRMSKAQSWAREIPEIIQLVQGWAGGNQRAAILPGLRRPKSVRHPHHLEPLPGPPGHGFRSFGHAEREDIPLQDQIVMAARPTILGVWSVALVTGRLVAARDGAGDEVVTPSRTKIIDYPIGPSLRARLDQNAKMAIGSPDDGCMIDHAVTVKIPSHRGGRGRRR